MPTESVTALIGTADGFVGTPTPALVRSGRRLRWVQVHAGGVEELLFPELLESAITLTSAKIIKGPEMADHAMALLLALTRQLDRAIAQRPQEKWSSRGYAPVELRGKTAVIIGLGGAGTQIAERAFAFGMRVIAVDPKDLPIMRAVERVVGPDRLADVLPEADVVFISAPLTEQTRGLLGDREFARMKAGVFIINVARGGIIRTDALVRAPGRWSCRRGRPGRRRPGAAAARASPVAHRASGSHAAPRRRVGSGHGASARADH